MRKLIAGLAFLFMLSATAFSQSASIKGTITDTAEKKNLSNAVVALLNKKDSILIKFIRSNKEGGFHIQNLTPGDYLLQVTYPKYADYADAISLKAEDFDIGSVPLTLKSVVLQEVIVRNTAAIKIKGDTTEFTADSFKVKEGATVEDLLKVMPGFTVNSKGQITSQGKKVDKVLVDGEEFFGDDPTIATQNLGARIVDKVQVFDTKTEQDQLKGIGGGSDSKTVNIKLKENAKRGYFGKLEAGSDFNKYTNAKAMFNRFVGKQKVSVYGNKSMTDAGSLGWEERNKLGIENDMEYDEIGGYYYSFGTNDDFNNWSLRGLPDAYAAGGLYNNKWNADKSNLNLSYKYNRLGTTNIGSTLKQTLLQDTTFYNNETTETKGLKEQHVISGKYEWKIDSLTTIKLTSAGTYKSTITSGYTQSQALNEDSLLVNNSDRFNDQTAVRKQLDNQLTYTQLFRKKDRKLITTLRFGLINDDNDGTLKATNKFYKNGALDSTDILDQLKTGTGESKTLGGKVTYNEPLNAHWNVVTEYSYNNANSTSKRNTFELDNNGKYTILNPVFSNNFDLNATSNSGTVTMRYISKKLRYAFGGGVSAVKLKVHNLDDDTRSNYNFTNFTPQAQFSYELKTQTNIGIRYNGTTQQPNLDQLQPIRNNNDPLNIYTGNPDLKVGFNHSLNLWYNSFKVLSGRYMYIGTGFNQYQNAITTFNTIDSFGRVTSMPVNVNGNQNWFMYGGARFGDGDKKWIHGLGLEANGGKNAVFINSEKSINTFTNFEVNYELSYSVQDKYNFRIRPKVGRNISTSSLRKDVDNNYWTYGGNINGYVMLPWSIEINTEIEFDLREKISAFDRNTNITLWTANISKKVFKNKSGKFIFTAYDLLNQNRGFERLINSNFVTDQRYQRVGQYFMLSFQWTFSKMPGQN